MQQELITLKREIRDLKTAQPVPSIMNFYSKTLTIPNNLTQGFHYWTIQFEASENGTDPISYDSAFVFVFEFYDSATNTQKIVLDAPYNNAYAGAILEVYSTRPIISITMDS